MIESYRKFLRKAFFVLDISIVSILFPIAVALHNKLGVALKTGLFPYIIHSTDWNLFNFAPVLIWLLPVWFISLYECKAYESFRSKYILDTVLNIINASILVSLVSFAILLIHGFESIGHHGFSTKYHIGYSIILIYPALCAAVLISSRILLIAGFRIVRTMGYNQRQIIIVGTGPRAQRYIRRIIDHPGWGLKIIGFVLLEENEKIPKQFSHYPVVGRINNMKKVLDEHPVDEVFFIVPRKWLDRIDPAVTTCGLLGITVHVAVDLFNMKLSQLEYSEFHGLPILSLNTTSINYPALAFKRTMDIFVSAIGLLLFLPFTIVIIILIKIESPGPVFFVQERNGLNGRIFKMYKFRTMVENAEEIKKNLLHKNEISGPVFKIKNDPRITKIGKILRKWSMDEVPQLVNVLLGDMSLVGPRPPIPQEVSKYKPWQRRRLSMRPGITCIWQVSGRNKIKFENWMEMDLNYIDNWSLLLDFKILLKTIPSVLWARGSY